MTLKTYTACKTTHKERSRTRGSIMLLVLVFGSVFFTVLVGLSGFVLAQNRAQEVTRAQSEATGIAEAGLEYYRWLLSHYPGDTQNHTGHNGPFVVEYQNGQGQDVGAYTLSIVSNSACGTVQSIDVTSKGTPSDAPGVSTTLWARYAQPSVARYNMILNSSVWFGAGPIYGPIHSNGGIRMDGNPNAPVSSSITSWTCDASFGCSGKQTEPGVFGSGSNPNLWSFPTPQTDFGAIASDYTSLKSVAQGGGLYFPRISTAKNPYLGYHLVFNGDGTVTVYKVTGVNTRLYSYSLDTLGNSYQHDYSLITSESSVGTYAIPSNCGIIFVEDNTWIEGAISQKVTVVAAVTSTSGVYPNIILPNNITYTAYDGSAGLTAIASHDVLVGPTAPSDLTLDGIFVAQSGAFGLNEYPCSSFGNKSTLNMLGTVVTSLRPVTDWSYGGCSGYSGYPNGTSAFDRQNSTNPPPFTPVTSTQWQFVDWKQK